MHDQDYDIPISEAEVEIEIKGSRFIACLAHTDNEASAAEFLTEVQRRWPKASHYCSASVFSAPNNSQRLASSDDGEPSGTAGRPMLMALQSSGVGEVTAIVVRYFGGVKLGTGGLQRAYTEATVTALAELEKERRVFKQGFQLHFAYTDQGDVEPILFEAGVETASSEYGESVLLTVLLRPIEVETLQKKLQAATRGRVQLKPLN
ncbi:MULTISPECIES: YigZ family protein [Idiomarina]|uniref:YigZ family protein n=1 Tax=Idiomarina abyssalis TaxID=86102 RepID=A0A8I1KHX0_9GAMM|nr:MULTISPECIES: YigZ family protein [Idiomarina]MAO69006.1 YigZ family protein [Idiomarina sp.]MBF80944.1 YigZ family protein [Idiomarina sp.]MBJ7266136.1 YigZ family protein [Idiomarina abyssalis]MBJ7272807.1 YigZ family protein [Idiomarina abyssalis]MBJ7316275.1 YigZ family protein [Idiomarina abyssalis]